MMQIITQLGNLRMKHVTLFKAIAKKIETDMHYYQRDFPTIIYSFGFYHIYIIQNY